MYRRSLNCYFEAVHVSTYMYLHLFYIVCLHVHVHVHVHVVCIAMCSQAINRIPGKGQKWGQLGNMDLYLWHVHYFLLCHPLGGKAF